MVRGTAGSVIRLSTAQQLSAMWVGPNGVVVVPAMVEVDGVVVVPAMVEVNEVVELVRSFGCVVWL